jgi:uncharacterized delta-60 repeat protein
VAIQADGKIVVVGGGGFALARYNPNGSLDTSFSGDGKQTTDFGCCANVANAVAIQANGKIVTVGSTDANSGGDFALARYNPNGTLDTTFSGDGKQTTDLGGRGSVANAVALQANGKIVAAGVGGGGTHPEFALARYEPNGSLDPAFSGDGKQTTDFGMGAADAANGIAIQGDGKIVTVGRASGGSTGDDFAIARYNPNGTLDVSFSDDGRNRTNFGASGAFDGANGVALQGDGRIVAVGDGNGEFALARYLGG